MPSMRDRADRFIHVFFKIADYEKRNKGKCEYPLVMTLDEDYDLALTQARWEIRPKNKKFHLKTAQRGPINSIGTLLGRYLELRYGPV